MKADTRGRCCAEPNVLKLVVEQLAGQRLHVDDRMDEDVDVAASEMTVRHLRSRRRAKGAVVRDRSAGQRVFPDELPIRVEREVLGVSGIACQARPENGRPVVSFPPHVLDDRLKLDTRSRHNSIDRLNRHELFVDHRRPNEVGPIGEVVRVGMRRMQLANLFPVVRQQLELVAVELHRPIAHAFDVASQPLARSQPNPVLLIAELDRIGLREAVLVLTDHHRGLRSSLVFVQPRTDLRRRGRSPAEANDDYQHDQRQRTPPFPVLRRNHALSYRDGDRGFLGNSAESINARDNEKGDSPLFLLSWVKHYCVWRSCEGRSQRRARELSVAR